MQMDLPILEKFLHVWSNKNVEMSLKGRSILTCLKGQKNTEGMFIPGVISYKEEDFFSFK